MEYRYYPVFRKQNMYHYDDSDIRKNISFFNEDSIIKYDYFLVNAYHYRTKTIKELTGIEEFKNVNILGDSGGFQIINGKLQEIKLLRPEILKWLEENCNYSMILDIPPVVCDYDTALKQTIDNCKYFKSNQIGKTRFINVIHGNTYDEIIKWIDNIEQFGFDGGYAIGGLVSNPNKQFKTLMTLIVLWKNGILERLNSNQLLHILGETDTADLILPMYFLHRINMGNFILSSDSKYCIDLSSRNLFHTKFQNLCDKTPRKIPFKPMIECGYRCTCPICSNDYIFNNMQNGNITLTDFIYAHNHNIILNRLIEVFNISKLTYNVLKYYFKKEVLEKLKVIDKIVLDKDKSNSVLKQYISLFTKTVTGRPLF